MSRFVKIDTVRWQTYVVELEDGEADDSAYDFVSTFDESTMRALEPNEVEAAIRHADVVERL